MPRPSLDEIFAAPSGKPTIADLYGNYDAPDNRPSLDEIFGQSQSPNAPQNFMERLNGDYNHRLDQMKTIANQKVEGDISGLEANARMGLKYAQLLPDAATETLVSGFRALPDVIQQPIRRGANNVITNIADSPVGDLARSAINSYKGFEQNHPIAAGRISSVADVGNLAAGFIPIKGSSAISTAENALAVPAKVTGKVVKRASSPITKNISSVAEGVLARSPEELQAASDLGKTTAGGIYNQMRAQGAVLNASTSNGLLSTITASIAKNKFIPNLNPKTTSIIDDLTENIRANKGEIGLDELDQYRRLLNRVGGSEDGVSAIAAKQAIDGIVENLQAHNLTNGNSSAVSLLKRGRSEYAKASRFDEVANLLIKADGDPNKIKTGLTRFVSNKENLKGFNLSEIAALKDAARNNVSEKLLKMFGKFGIDLGTSMTPGNTIGPLVGGYLASPALPLAGTVARQGQKYIARGKAEKALKIIGERP
jgi:hypothetical protein